MSFLFHDTGDVVLLSASAYANISPIIAKALGAYHATLAVAQLGVDCISSDLDWIVELATKAIKIIETLPIPDDISIPKRARFERWGKRPVKRPFPLRLGRNATALEHLKLPVLRPRTHQLPSLQKLKLGSSPLSEKAHNFETNRPPISPPTSRDVDTPPAPWKPCKADYWSTAPFAQAGTLAPKTEDSVRARRNAARLDTIAEDSSEATVPGSNTTSTPIATSPSHTTPPATTSTAIERPTGNGAQGAAGKSRTPHDSGAAWSTQVSGTALKTGLVGNLRLEVADATAAF